MKVHYFQRYHGKENVATANLTLLLSRLYHYSPNIFFNTLFSADGLCQDFSTDMEVVFNQQEKTSHSVVDATISQDSFKIAIETKLWDWFYKNQLSRHLSCFSNQNLKILLTVSSEKMNVDKKMEVDQAIEKYNDEHNDTSPVRHINTTFEEIIEKVKNNLENRDYEMMDIVTDYEECCIEDNLIFSSDAWKYIRMQLASTTLDYNIRFGVYYDNAGRGFRDHKYLALYKNKAVRAIGEIKAIIRARKSEDGTFCYDVKSGELTEERKNLILEAGSHAKKEYGYNLDDENYFFVDKFYETNFQKTSKGPSMGTRIFNLSVILGLKKDSEVSTEEIAEQLKNKTWQ